MEKNRRNQMKLLYSNLNSLLPPNQSTDSPLTVSDQIEEAIKYIKSLEMKLQKCKEKKERILARLNMSSALSDRASTNNNSPELRIKEMGSIVEVVFTRGFEDRSLFDELIGVFHEERAEIINLNYSVHEDMFLYSIHAQIEDVVYELGAKKLVERLNKLVYEWKSDAEMLAGGASSSGHGGTHPPANIPTMSSGRHF
ncbi:transcription factor bHLH162-like [Cucurbita moschata]|uniref:Transcription factor bHLH162-like n=1 Tax=Cucurbita moschata TaxID=3662 RepID=A0A6J1G8Q1_CUCMO|nr:transcription factor bHLH162-like [Cucurbita moschata]